MFFKLEPAKVFGQGATASIEATMALLNVSLKDVSESQGSWLNQIQVVQGEECSAMPWQCPQIGTIFLIIYSNGKIDRMKVVKKGVLRCYLRPASNGHQRRKPPWEDYYYQAFRIGQRAILTLFSDKKWTAGRRNRARIYRIIMIK